MTLNGKGSKLFLCKTKKIKIVNKNMEIYGSSNLDSVATEVMELLCVMNLKISG